MKYILWSFASNRDMAYCVLHPVDSVADSSWISIDLCRDTTSHVWNLALKCAWIADRRENRCQFDPCFKSLHAFLG